MEEDTTIAVVGIGCIFPGADNIEEFWRVLVNGEDHVQDIPPDRFNVDAFYDPNPDSPRKTYVRKAGLVKSFDEWDNKFFGISDKEAELVDPQQHFVLEAVHMALEDGGITRERLNGSETGVYIGAMNHDWDCLLRSAKQNSTNTMVTGVDSSILSARVAYFYNLLGPAMTIETACSSSMVAIHTASQALRNGEISMAIAGGVSFILDPESFINLSSARMASPTGKCHTFSKDADGYARGEGCGIVILKKLADAIKDGNKIWGTIFTWLNQDGHLSSPITSPSGEQQEKLVETIYRKSNIPPSSVQYIEAHASYWAANVFRPVLFRHAIQEAKKMNPNALFLEIGPSPVLRAHLSSIFPDSVEESLPSMKRDYEIDIFRKTLLDIFGKGIQVTWENVVLRTTNILSIPKYQFNKRKHLVKSEKLQSLLSGEESNINKMLISRLPGSSEQFNMLISHENTPFIYEHVVDGSTVVPGALYGEIGLEIGHYLLPNSEITEFDISWSIHRAFLVKDSEQTLVIKSRQESDNIIYYEAYASGNKFMLSSGKVTFNRTPPKPVLDVQRLNSLLSTESESHIVYMMLQSLGFQHGPIYQTIKKCVIRDRETICDIRISDGVMKEISRTCLHPVILDTMFQSCFGINVGNGNGQKTRILPIKVSHLVVRQRPSQSMICYTTPVQDDAMNASFNILLLQKNGSIVAEMMNFKVEKINSPDDLHSLSYHESWKPVQLQGKTFTERFVFVLSWNSEYLSLVENTFRKEHGNIDICSISLAKTSDNEFSTLQKKAESQSISVIFAPGLPGIDENTTGRWLSDTIRRTTQVFLQLLKAIYKMKSHILVVTNETQPCYSPKTRVIGAELWGMVRAVSHEGTELSFTLLDVDSLSEFSLINISRVFAGLDVGSRQVPDEYAIRGNIIYTNEITKLSESFHTRLYKKNFQKAPQPLCIRQKLEGDESSFLAMPCSKESTNQLAICVKPTNVLACTEDTYFIQSNNSPELYCTDTNINGENINACELIGFAKIGNKDTEVIACCHMELKTVMMIDKHCVFAKSGFSGYRLGDMHAVIIALSIADLVEKKSNVFIEYGEETCTIFHFLCIMLKEKKCNISNQMKANGKKTQNTYATELVLLSADGYLEKDTLHILYPNVKQCISLSGILPRDFSMDSNCSMQFQLIDIAYLYKTKQLRVALQRASRVLMAALKKKKPRNNFPLHKSSLNVVEISKDIEVRTSKEFLIRDDSAYIVVGGLTGLGWLIVKYLAQRKANKIISLSRRSPSSELEKQILNIKNLHGVEIIHKEVDITNLNSLTKVLRSVQQQMPDVPIRGVLQGAAVINDNTVPKMTKEKFEMPLIVKVLGTWNLHHLTKHMDLDVFTLHSSVASVFGNYSQTNYAAANAFLDSFAYYRRSLGLPAQVINWGALTVGMGSDPTLKDIFFHKGIGLLSARQICNALTQMFLSDQIQGIFVDLDIKRFLTSNNLNWKASKYAGLISDEEESVPKVVSESETTYESGGNMIDLIKQISAQVLMIDVSEIENTNTLAQFGVDSQNSIEIINTIYSATKVRIPILLLLSGDFTIQELANFLSNKMSDNSSEELSSGRHSSESTSMVKRYYESDQLRQSAYVFSFTIPHEINNPEFWKRVIQFLARLNPTVRVDGSESTGQTDSPNESVDIEDFIIPFEFVQTTNELQTKLAENRDMPLSVIYEAETNKAHLYMTCSRMKFDAFCGKIIQKDLQKIATYIIAKNPVPAWLDKTNVDFLSLYSSKLHTVAETSKTYWQHRLRLCKTSASLKSKYPMLEHKHNEGKISLAMIDLNQHKDLLCENEWTMCNIVCSAFQIALHKITTVERVPILMEVDLRSQILECQEHILSSSNHIPLVSPNFFQPGVTVREVLNKNEQKVKEGIANCLYPFPAIMELKEFDSKLHKTHSYLFDTSDIADEQYVRLASTHIEKNPTFETLLYALHNKTDQTLKLEFHFCPERVSTYTASILTESVSNFIQALSENHTKTLKQLQMQTKLARAPMASPKASFLLVKENGNRKKVFMEVKQGTPPLVSWGPNSNSQSKMTEIMDVDIVQDNGRSGLRLWLFGRKAMTFETSEDQVCQAWVTFLKQHLPPTSFKKQEFEENENYIQSTELEVENTYL
ncbi:uncharacterized protein LOC134229445 [Saccostrea cucullata]|uniref:uncharacterized protein LOC134229445 n=1 Tax=Saccostrea cuccullata TaxID=36930 RepID=UPI002ED2B370